MISTLTPNEDSEEEKYMAISDLILQIEKISQGGNNHNDYIKRPRVLISALRQLADLVEMEEVKQICIELVCKFIIKKCQKFKNRGFNDRVMHFCNYGEPGTGKTQASKIIAKIIYGLGYNEIHFEKEAERKQNIKLGEIVENVDTLSKNAVTAQRSFFYLKDKHPKKRIVCKKPSPEKKYSSDENKVSPEHSLRELRDKISPDKYERKCSDEHKRRITYVDENIVRLTKVLTPEERASKINRVLSSDEIVKTFRSSSRRNSEDVSWLALESSLFISTETLKKTSDLLIELISSEEEKQITIDDDPNVEESVYCTVCGRNELVAKFMGQSSGLAYDFMMANRGKTIIIEEAYILFEGDKDIFGIEALVEINRFMDEHPGEASISFNGYGTLLAEGIFRIQPGLKSRINYFFNMVGYKPSGLAKIFQGQINLLNMILDDTINIEEFFINNMQYFNAYGRDTFRLAEVTERTYSFFNFENLIQNSEMETKFVITPKIFKAAVKRYIKCLFH
jgi:hypothetical protein